MTMKNIDTTDMIERGLLNLLSVNLTLVRELHFE